MKFIIIKNLTSKFFDLPVQVGKVAAIQDFEADAVDDLRVFLPGSELVVRHQSKQNGDQIFDAVDAETLPKRPRVEEREEVAE